MLITKDSSILATNSIQVLMAGFCIWKGPWQQLPHSEFCTPVTVSTPHMLQKLSPTYMCDDGIAGDISPCGSCRINQDWIFSNRVQGLLISRFSTFFPIFWKHYSTFPPFFQLVYPIWFVSLKSIPEIISPLGEFDFLTSWHLKLSFNIFFFFFVPEAPPPIYLHHNRIPAPESKGFFPRKILGYISFVQLRPTPHMMPLPEQAQLGGGELGLFMFAHPLNSTPVIRIAAPKFTGIFPWKSGFLSNRRNALFPRCPPSTFIFSRSQSGREGHIYWEVRRTLSCCMVQLWYSWISTSRETLISIYFFGFVWTARYPFHVLCCSEFAYVSNALGRQNEPKRKSLPPPQIIRPPIFSQAKSFHPSRTLALLLPTARTQPQAPTERFAWCCSGLHSPPPTGARKQCGCCGQMSGVGTPARHAPIISVLSSHPGHAEMWTPPQIPEQCPPSEQCPNDQAAQGLQKNIPILPDTSVFFVEKHVLFSLPKNP